ncbi:F-box protein SKIP2-like isoform X2 [Belonocnema kinseyi]|uniref:F-box protein SKIP2-like isoform X2 n=1 Tax=Belonocnema kinseyi TaxID=2817044 RepID=UPI00143D187F|nr:F-box protein SKIP2-like isoform X2 [Belonocnema kinseyi]
METHIHKMTENGSRKRESSKKVKIPNADSAPISKIDDFCLDYIFQFLNICERVQIERVCKRWQYVSRRSWYTFKKLDYSPNRGWPRRNMAVQLLDQEVIQPVLERCGRFLQSLNLSVEGIRKIYRSENIVVVIAANCQKLKVLDMSVLSVPAEAFTFLIPCCRNLRKLVFSIEGESKACEETIIKLLKKAKKLKHFSTDFNSIHLDSFPADTIEEIILNQSIIRISENLRVFKMFELKSVEGDMALSSEGLENIGKLQNLEKLDVRGNYNILTDEVMAEIAKRCKKIAFLNISHNYKLTDKVLDALSNLKQLQCLIMNSNEVTGENLWRLYSLEKLECKWCRKLKTENLILLVEISTNLKFLNCFGCCSINNDFLQAAAYATAGRVNETVLEMCTLETSMDIDNFQNRSPLLRIDNSPAFFEQDLMIDFQSEVIDCKDHESDNDSDSDEYYELES